MSYYEASCIKSWTHKLQPLPALFLLVFVDQKAAREFVDVTSQDLCKIRHMEVT